MDGCKDGVVVKCWIRRRAMRPVTKLKQLTMFETGFVIRNVNIDWIDGRYLLVYTEGLRGRGIVVDMRFGYLPLRSLGYVRG